MRGTLPNDTKTKKFDYTPMEQYIIRTKGADNKETIFINHTLGGSIDTQSMTTVIVLLNKANKKLHY